jgi:hypothetical protein
VDETIAEEPEEEAPAPVEETAEGEAVAAEVCSITFMLKCTN